MARPAAQLHSSTAAVSAAAAAAAAARGSARRHFPTRSVAAFAGGPPAHALLSLGPLRRPAESREALRHASGGADSAAAAVGGAAAGGGGGAPAGAGGASAGGGRPKKRAAAAEVAAAVEASGTPWQAARVRRTGSLRPRPTACRGEGWGWGGVAVCQTGPRPQPARQLHMSRDHPKAHGLVCQSLHPSPLAGAESARPPG